MRLYRTLVLERPLLSISALVIVLALAGLGMPHFKLDASSDSLTLESDRDLDYFRQMTQRFDSGDILVVTYRPDGDLFGKRSLDNLEQLTESLAGVEGVKSVLSILNVPLLYSPPISFTDLSDTLPLLRDEGVDTVAARNEFQSSPIYRDTLISADETTTGILLNLDVDQGLIAMARERDELLLKRRQSGLSAEEQGHLDQLKQTYLDARTAAAKKDAVRVAEIRQLVAPYQAQATLFIGGASMVSSDMIRFIRSDLITFGVGILLFMLATLILIFRKIRLVIWPLLACLSTALLMIGLLGWLDWRLTVISSNFISLLLIITLAITIHLVVRYQELSALAANTEGGQGGKSWKGEPHVDIVARTVSQMAMPCFYTALTTIVAFVSLVVSDIRPVIDFGWMMTLGILAALVITFWLVPAGLVLLPPVQFKSEAEQESEFMAWVASLIERFSPAIMIICAVFAIGASAGVVRLDVENRFIDYFKPSSEIHQGMKTIDQNLGGTMSLDLVLSAPADWGVELVDGGQTEESIEEGYKEGGEFDDFDEFSDFDEDASFEDDDFGFDEGAEPAIESYWWNRSGIQVVEKLHDYLESQEDIGKVNSIATGYKVARDLVGSELNDIELAFMRQSLDNELQDILITPYLNDQEQEVRISTRVKESAEGLSRKELIERVTQFANNELGLEPGQVRATGLIVLYNNMLQSLFGSQIQTLAAVFVGIMLMFLLLFRSWLISMIALIPNLLAAALVLGAMGALGIPLDIMTITIAAITVGMGVDHAIHYIYRFRVEFQNTSDYWQSMRRSHVTTGRALFYTALTIIIGFSVLTLSNFIPSIYFGLMTSLAMLAATLGSLTLLPALMVALKPLGR